jgi:heme-degrading monooxygenase HmoA
MIARIWRGRVRAEDADAYASYLTRTGLPDYRDTPGNRGVYVLRQVKEAEAGFLILSLWDSLDAVRSFAGDDVERARYYPEDARFLLAMEPTVAHYDVLAAPGAL